MADKRNEGSNAMAEKKINPIRETDEAARELGHKLVAGAHYGALGVVEPQTGMPLVSRIAVACDPKGQLIFLASELSFHSKALALDGRASVLLGEPGKGDPLAHPRITLIGMIERVDASLDERDELRGIWLERHPKAELYIDFGDFHFFRLALERAHLNGGFGKAFVLSPGDLGMPGAGVAGQ